jgi:hypothetical protein
LWFSLSASSLRTVCPPAALIHSIEPQNKPFQQSEGTRAARAHFDRSIEIAH